MNERWIENVDLYQKTFRGMWDQASGDDKTIISAKELEKANKEAEKSKVKVAKEKAKRLQLVNKEFGFQLEKIFLKDGDIIIVHLTCKPKLGLSELIHQLMDMKPVKNLKIPVLIIPAELELSTMDEKEMNKAGWYKRGHRLVRPIT